MKRIESYILGAGMASEDVTKTALQLINKYCYEVDSFQYENGRMPNVEELVTSNWLALFEVFLRHGLDTASSFSEDGINYDNVLLGLTHLDNQNVVYKLFRLLFNNGASPNVVINGERLFDIIDETPF